MSKRACHAHGSVHVLWWYCPVMIRNDLFAYMLSCGQGRVSSTERQVECSKLVQVSQLVAFALSRAAVQLFVCFRLLHHYDRKSFSTVLSMPSFRKRAQRVLSTALMDLLLRQPGSNKQSSL